MAALVSGAAPSSRVEALRRQCREVSSDIQLLAYRAKKARKGAKQKPFSLTPTAERLVVGVYVLSDYNTTQAAQKLMSFKSTGASCSTLLEAERLVEDIFMSMPDDFVANILCAEDPATKRIAAAARSYIAESRTVDWVEQQNLARGIAPSSVAARIQFEELSHAHAPASSSIGLRGARQWARRWSRRWAVKRGNLHRQEPLDTQVLVDKAT